MPENKYIGLMEDSGTSPIGIKSMHGYVYKL